MHYQQLYRNQRFRLNHNKLKGEKVEIKNVTLDRGVIGIIGPNSRKVLQKITDTNLSNENFPWLKSKEINKRHFSYCIKSKLYG